MNIPDEIEIEKDDETIEKIRKENVKEEDKDETKRGKCGCLIF